jgi:putative transposase
MQYHRVYIKGGTYFFTVVTFNRLPILTNQKSIDYLNNALLYTVARMPFVVVANVILPDHMHFIWTLPEDSYDYSTRWRLIKSYFTHAFHRSYGESRIESRRKKGEQDIWQRRFWEHLIRDDRDLTHHIEYIHYNPVKHGLVNSCVDWKYSSFMDYAEMGLYPKNWGEKEKIWSGNTCME